MRVQAHARSEWERGRQPNRVLRARAIESTCDVIAPHGTAVTRRPGHRRLRELARGGSLGLVVARASDGDGIVVAGLELDRLAAFGRQVPARADR